MQAVQCHLVVKALDADAASTVAERVQHSTEITARFAKLMARGPSRDTSIHLPEGSVRNNINQVPRPLTHCSRHRFDGS